MKRKTALLILCFLAVSLLLFAQDSERRTALVIGNAAYQSSPLQNPLNDARDMAQVLRELGFTVTVKLDCGAREMEQAIREFGNELVRGGVGLFYYAGHGMQVGGRNYLIPVDADIRAEDEVKFFSVDAGLLLSKMESAGNRTNMVILDACRDNPFWRSFRTENRGLAVVEAPRGSLVIYATAPGSVAAESRGRNGVFTGALLKHIKTPGIEVEAMLEQVHSDVLAATGGEQVPWSSSSLAGGFCFAAAGGRMELPKVPEGFVLVEGGTFQMGFKGSSDSDWLSGDKPVHSVTVSSFYLGKYEVTQKQWVTVMSSNPSGFEGDNLPVEYVNWFEAVEFCNRLSIKEGIQPCYTISGTSVNCDFSKNGYRLPTEAEWEYAAKGGRLSRGYMYAGWHDVRAVGWCSANSGGTTHAVGRKEANELGLYDMSGNVGEWCWDWYGSYSAGSQTDPRGPSSGQQRVLRGGSWADFYSDMLRTSFRGRSKPGDRFVYDGFRLARSRS